MGQFSDFYLHGWIVQAGSVGELKVLDAAGGNFNMGHDAQSCKKGTIGRIRPTKWRRYAQLFVLCVKKFGEDMLFTLRGDEAWTHRERRGRE